jgi:hypothetical protein
MTEESLACQAPEPVGARSFSARVRRALAHFAIGAGSLILAAVVWLPTLHLFFMPGAADYFTPAGSLAPEARKIARAQLDLWEDPVRRGAVLEQMRATNPEWDFMGRTFYALALANMSLRNPADADRHLALIDRIVSDTLALERGRDRDYFLMDYARGGEFAAKNGRSVFVDGEVALMIGARRLVREHEPYRAILQERVTSMVLQMEQSPVLCAESYPNECWMFCNCVAAAAIRIGDLLDGSDHSGFLKRWVATVKERLVHRESGMLVSAFDFEGHPDQGPEGSSIWMSAHCLAVVDPGFAREQYDRAKRELGMRVCGFAYAKEWPASWKALNDVDSGPVIPVLEVSAGSSGLAFLGAATFGDTEFLRGLITTLRFAAFPVERDGRLRFAASNQVGDAVLLYSLAQGPLWKLVRERGTETGR